MADGRRSKAPQFIRGYSTGDERAECEKRVNEHFFAQAMLDRFYADTKQEPINEEDSVYLGR